MRGSNKLPKRGMEVRTSEREGRIEGGKEGGVKKRKATPLSLYYPSVTGLLGSCYGYRDSRLSVLLTIAHKGSIQLQAMMQISLTRSVFFSFCLCFYFRLHLSLNMYTFPHSLSLPPKLQTEPPIRHPPTATIIPLFDVSIPLPLPLSLYS